MNNEICVNYIFNSTHPAIFFEFPLRLPLLETFQNISANLAFAYFALALQAVFQPLPLLLRFLL